MFKVSFCDEVVTSGVTATSALTSVGYMQLKLSNMPEDVIAHYQLLNITTQDGYVYCEICQGIYVLLQVGIIAQELLAKKVKEHGYNQSKTAPGMWTHEWCPIIFSLVIKDFGVKYIEEEHAQHLIQTVQKIIRACSKKKENNTADSP
jgi:hypothetical protein